MPKVSIIIPFYNVEKYISDCLNSVFNQTYNNIEVIIIDDASTDKSVAIVKSFMQANYDVTLLQSEEHHGIGYNRNLGLSLATGDYIAFVDADDIIRPDMIEKLMAAIKGNNVDIAMCRHQSFVGEPRRQRFKEVSPRIIDLAEESDFLYQIGGHVWNKLCKRELFDNLKFPEGIDYEDIAVTYPILIRTQKIAYIDEPLYCYRRNINGITLSVKRIPNRGVIDLYYSTLKLEQNYCLIRQSNHFDNHIRNLAHSFMYLSALNAVCWLQVPVRLHSQIVSNLMYLADQHYGVTNHFKNPRVRRRLMSIPYLGVALIGEILKRNPNIESLSDEQVINHVIQLIEEYNSSQKEKVKKKL